MTRSNWAILAFIVFALLALGQGVIRGCNQGTLPWQQGGELKMERTTHPSWGNAVFHRVSGTRLYLHGSSIPHSEAIMLTISEDRYARDLSTDWHMPGNTLVEVAFSPEQFSQLLTTMNMGCGVPCTVRYHPREGYQNDVLESTPKREAFNNELSETIADLSSKFDSARSGLKGKVSEKALQDLDVAISHFKSNLRFLDEQFKAQMDKTVSEAKAEVDAFITGAIVKSGIKALQATGDNAQLAIEAFAGEQEGKP